MEVKPLLIFSILFLTAVISISGQSPVYVQYTNDEGLPSNTIYGVIQDQFGYIWAYSEKGVAKFDGQRFRQFTSQDGLPGNDIWQLSEDKHGRIWIHTFANKMCYFQFDSVHCLESSPPLLIECYHINETDDQIWFQSTAHQTYTVQNRELNWEKQSPIGYNSDQKFFINLPNEQQLLLSSDKAETINIQNGEIIRTTSISSLVEERLSTFYHNTPRRIQVLDSLLFVYNRTDGLIGLNINTGKILDINLDFHFPNLNNYQAYLIRRDSVFNFSTDYGAFLISSELEIIDLHRLPPFMQEKEIGKIFIDRENNHWLCTLGEGIYFFPASNRNIDLLSNRTTNPGKVELLSSNPLVTIWVEEGNKIYAFYQNKVYHVEIPSIPSEKILDLVCTKDNNFIISYPKKSVVLQLHLDLIDTTLATPLNSIQRLPTTIKQQNLFFTPTSLAWNEANHELIVGIRNGYTLFRMGKEPNFELPGDPFRPGFRANQILCDEEGNTWMCTSEGLKCIRENELIHYDEEFPFLDGRLISIAIANQTLWIGTDGQGVIGLQQDSVFQLKATQGDIVQALIAEDENRLWVATNQGLKLIQINPPFPANSQVVREYTTTSGLPSNEVVNISKSGQNLFVATAKGLIRINLEEEPDWPQPSPLLLEEVRMNDQVQPLQSSYTFSRIQNNIQVYYTGLSIQSQGKVTYQYILEGYDTEWTTSQTPYATYQNLPSGNYTFRVKGADIRGIPFSSEIFFDITISKAWWQNLFTYLTGVILIIGSFYLFSRQWIRRVKEKEQNVARVDQRIAELELQALQAQMNPHFIYNSLGAIQSFIRSSSTEEADSYLTKFARLMRLFLESSKKSFITLEEELTLLSLYLQLEVIRFDDRIRTSFSVDPEIDVDQFEVPTMVIQPFIENAINHGLFHKAEGGSLEINFRKEGEEVLCEVNDNGVGRERSAEIRKASGIQHKSRSMQIVHERLEVLNQKENYPVEIHIEDIYDEEGVGSGTKVQFRFSERH